MSINLVIGVGIGLVIGGFAVFVKMRLSQRFDDLEKLVHESANSVFRSLGTAENRLDRADEEMTARIDEVAKIVDANSDDTTDDFEAAHRRMDVIETRLDELSQIYIPRES